MNPTIKTHSVFVFRHGRYEPPGFITPDGRKQLESMGDCLRVTYKLTEATTAIRSSQELRAIRSVYSLAEGLGFKGRAYECDECQELFSNDRVCDVNAAMKAIEPLLWKYENVIVVTHYEMTAKLTSALLQKFCGDNAWAPSELGYGECWALDLKAKTVSQLEPQAHAPSPA